MKNREIQEIYSSIADGIANSIKNDWETASIEIEWFGDAGDFSGNYKVGVSVNYFEVDDSIFDDVEELHEITTENDSNKWNRAVFNLKPTGEFNIDFSWNQELADEIERLNNE
ncbi:immunity protein YezG family protein [Pseudoalteromonas sp. TB64]|uniref:immunity protein YezG family protein n=1 Tax=Pseudoalteromonas sp. TB64 TaxID=1938600 RepID=UPI00041A97C5|nr:immunity protein YezG family protein [Pseudoalteromonas sp. TB64]